MPSPTLARVLILPLLLWGCAEAPDVAQRSAVLITLDTTTPESIDLYGDDAGVTPNLVALAARGVVFDAARSVAPLTLPAHTSMQTGLYPPRHTVRDNGHLAVPPAADTLAERARAAGYRTGAFVAAGVMAEPYGLGQGFDVYEAPPAQTPAGTFSTRWAGEMTRRATAWLDRREPGRPFFLWVHYFDPHAPYNPPPKFLKQVGGDAYLAEVATMDAQIGRLLERLAQEPDHDATTILVVADHGEALGRNGEQAHGMLLHDATLSVPLLVRFPGDARAGQRRADLVSVVDVFPTLLAAMGLEVPPHLDGQDLAAPVQREGVYAECYHGYLNYGFAPLAGWATREGLYVHGARTWVDATARAAELRPAPEDAPWIERARSSLEALGRAPALPRPARESRIDSDLVGLGYAGAGGADIELPAPLDVPGGLPAPSERLGEVDRMWEGLKLADSGRLEEGIALLRAISADNPRNSFAHDWLGELLLRAERPREALVPLRAMIAAGLERPSLRRRLAIAHRMLGEVEQARAELARYEALCPDDPEARALAEEIERQAAGDRP